MSGGTLVNVIKFFCGKYKLQYVNSLAEQFQATQFMLRTVVKICGWRVCCQYAWHLET